MREGASFGPGSSSLRSPEPVPVSAPGNDPLRADAPSDFVCAICGHVTTNRFNWDPRDHERPPICKSCENVTGYSWTGAARCRVKPTGGTFRDRREALRIEALADAIAAEATRQNWEKNRGRA